MLKGPEFNSRHKDNDTVENHMHNHDKECICTSSTGLFVPSRELSYCVAGGLLGLFFVFMAGFFWGQQCAIKDFVQKLNQDSFADQVASSLYMLSDTMSEGVGDVTSRDGARDAQEQDTQQIDDLSGGDADGDDEGVERDADDTSGDAPDTERLDTAGEMVETRVITDPVDSESKQLAVKDVRSGVMSVGYPHKSNADPDGVVAQNMYYAPLIGFGTLAAADQFVSRITKKGFSAKVEKRKSKTARGRLIFWYQVVTDSYADKAQLEKVIDILVRQEKLKDVRILSC